MTMATGALTGSTLTAEDVFDQLTRTGVSRAEAQVVVANWILGNAGQVPRSFTFQTPFPAADPACAGQFTRSFAHHDWVDGEDVVQAEKTTGEDGFNLRFHQIEGDLDSAGRDLAQAFVCINAMRSALRGLLDEVQAEINLIHQRIATGGGGIVIDPVPTGPVLGGQFVGTTKFFDKDVHVFQTASGRIMLPAVEGVTVSPWDNPRIWRTQAVAQFIAGPDVASFFTQDTPPAPPTKAAFVERFGDTVLANSETVRTALEIIPDEAPFASGEAVLDELSSREGAAIRTSGVERDSITAAFQLEGAATVADAPLDRLDLLPSDARTALVQMGVPTVGAFVDLTPEDLTRRLQKAGVDAHTADVAGWRAAGMTLTRAA
jgi:hypothetical protein